MAVMDSVLSHLHTVVDTDPKRLAKHGMHRSQQSDSWIHNLDCHADIVKLQEIPSHAVSMQIVQAASPAVGDQTSFHGRVPLQPPSFRAATLLPQGIPSSKHSLL